MRSKICQSSIVISFCYSLKIMVKFTLLTGYWKTNKWGWTFLWETLPFLCFTIIKLLFRGILKGLECILTYTFLIFHRVKQVWSILKISSILKQDFSCYWFEIIHIPLRALVVFRVCEFHLKILTCTLKNTDFKTF